MNYTSTDSEQDPSAKGNERVASAYKKAATVKKEPNWELVNDHLPLVKSMVGRMRMLFPTQTDVEDIYSIALMGLIGASQRYDASKGATFGHFAKLRVRGALFDEMRKMDWMSRNNRMTAKKYKASVDELEIELRREATDEEIRDKLDLSKYEHEKLKTLVRPMYLLPLDASGGVGDDSEGATLHDIIPDLTQMDARDVTEGKEARDMIREAIGFLAQTPQKVLVLYYVKELRLAEIAKVLDLSESRISQIHSKAILDLRRYMETKNN